MSYQDNRFWTLLVIRIQLEDALNAFLGEGGVSHQDATTEG